MQTEKYYYTPTIEEFRVGFDYEITNGYEWVKKTFCKEDLKSFLYESLENGIMQGYVRTKCLDEQDIKSIGFISISGYYELYMKKYFQRENITARIFYEEDGIVSLEVGDKGSKASEFRTVFYGNVKNKSELKKILCMLGISK
jgi:hypothetical protein